MERLRRERLAPGVGSAGGSEEQWGDLIEVSLEAVEKFGMFRYWDGVRGCLELRREIDRQSGPA